MFKYDVGMYKDKESNRVGIIALVNDDGYIGYDIEFIDEGNRQEYNLMEEEIDDMELIKCL